MKKLMLANLLLLLLSACQDSQTQNDNQANAKQKATTTTLHVIATLHAGEKLKTQDFDDTYFAIEKSHEQTVIKDEATCKVKKNNTEVECFATTNLSKLAPDLYRVIVKDELGGLLGAGIVEIFPNMVPVNVTVEDDDTGDYLLTLLRKDTHKSDSDIFAIWSAQGKIKNIRDLEITAYNIFIDNNGHKNFKYAFDQLLATLDGGTSSSIDNSRTTGDSGGSPSQQNTEQNSDASNIPSDTTYN